MTVIGGALALVAAGAIAAGPAAPAAPPADPATLGAAQLAGQRMIFGFPGTVPPPDLVRRIRRGEAAGVILLGPNVPTRAAARALTTRLQAIPRPPGLDAPLLVMIDQEGGQVRRLNAPPGRSAAALGEGSPASVRTVGRATGRALAAAGITVDLAPVADVARPGTFLAVQGRAFGSTPTRVARSAVAFAAGLRDARVIAAAKHFPGLGAAPVSTDDAPVGIPLSTARLRTIDLRPFRALIADDVPMVMLATATYPALDPGVPATLSRPIATRLLREDMGFAGVTVTDALDTPALAAVGGTGPVAVRAAGAGADLLIHTGYPAGVRAAAALTRAIRSGALPRAAAEESVARTLALRAR